MFATTHWSVVLSAGQSESPQAAALLEEIGRGGMGMVYRARQRSLDRVVAIKLMAFGPGSSPELVKRFRAEAVSAASLHHPNIVAIHEVGIHEGQHFFVMDYVAGRSLAQVISDLRSRISDFKQSARWMKTIAEAVHYAHERGILHRDLKPSNVLIDALVGRLPSAVRCLEVSPDGRWLAGGAELGGLKLWDLSTGEEFTLQSPRGILTYAAFSRDSRLLLFTDGVYGTPPPLGTVAIWDLGERKRLAPIKDLRGIGPIAFSPDGRCFGYGVAIRWSHRSTFGRGLVVLDFPSRKTLTEAVAETDQIDSVHGYQWVFTPDNRSAIYPEIGPKGELVCWDFTTNSKAQQFLISGEPITDMSISPDGHILATSSGFAETVIRLWEVPGFRSLGELSGHNRWVIGLKFSPDGRTLASASADQTIRLWDLSTRSPKSVPHRLRDEAWRVGFSPDGRQLFGGSKDGYIYCWSTDPHPRQPSFWLRATSLAAGSVVMAPDGKGIAGIRQGAVYLAETQGATLPSPVPGLGTNNLCLLFSSDGQFLFAGTQAGEIQVWSLTRQQLLRRPRGADDPVRRLEQDAGGRMLTVLQWGDPRPLKLPAQAGVSEMAEGQKQWFLGTRVDRPARVGVWSVAEWREQESWTIPGAVSACAVSPNGQFLATSHSQGTVYLWNLSGRFQSNSVVCPGAIGDLSFSPDGRLLAAAVFLAGLVRVWEVPTLQLRAELSHPEAVSALNFSPDSKRLATAGVGANALRLWDVATWQQLITMEHPCEEHRNLTFSRDGNQFSAANQKGEVLFWHAPSFTEIARRESHRAGAK